MKLRASSASVAAFAMIAALAASSLVARAQNDDKIDPKQDAEYARQIFADNVGSPKAYACFVRRYDAEHLAQHPLQKVSVMKLLITAEKVPEDTALNYSFRLGVNFRQRAGDFDSSGDCGHTRASANPTGSVQLGCGVDCDGGGINATLSPDKKSIIVRLDSIRIWRANKPDEDAAHSLQGGADDRVFRLERTHLIDCTALANDRKELAAMRHK
jgi:hypothetical protein